MEFSRQEYWTELPFPSQGDLPKPGIELRSPVLQAYSSPSEPPGEPQALNSQRSPFLTFHIHSTEVLCIHQALDAKTTGDVLGAVDMVSASAGAASALRIELTPSKKLSNQIQ